MNKLEYDNLVLECEKELQPIFQKIDEQEYQNSLKVLNAFKELNISESDFNGTTGYGYGDVGRDKIDKVFAKVLGSEDAIVRSQFISGTHALTVCLFGLLRPNDVLLSITGKPYDTLDEVIGIRDNPSSLKSFNIIYEQIDLIDNEFDFESINFKRFILHLSPPLNLFISLNTSSPLNRKEPINPLSSLVVNSGK